jgi:hypothetical protein
MIGRKDPLEYLQQRVQWADEAVVRERLRSHLISFDLLSKAHYANLDEVSFKQKLTKDFNGFLRDRAKLVVAAMNALTAGNSPTLEALWSAHLAEAASTAPEAEA